MFYLFCVFLSQYVACLFVIQKQELFWVLLELPSTIFIFIFILFVNCSCWQKRTASAAAEISEYFVEIVMCLRTLVCSMYISKSFLNLKA